MPLASNAGNRRGGSALDRGEREFVGVDGRGQGFHLRRNGVQRGRVGAGIDGGLKIGLKLGDLGHETIGDAGNGGNQVGFGSGVGLDRIQGGIDFVSFGHKEVFLFINTVKESVQVIDFVV